MDDPEGCLLMHSLSNNLLIFKHASAIWYMAFMPLSGELECTDLPNVKSLHLTPPLCAIITSSPVDSPTTAMSARHPLESISLVPMPDTSSETRKISILPSISSATASAAERKAAMKLSYQLNSFRKACHR